MMMKIEDIKKSIGLAGFEVKAKVARVWERKAGKSEEFGEWSFQHLQIQDETGKIMVVLKNREEFPKENEGKWFIFKGRYNEKLKKITGITVEEDEYENEKGEAVKMARVVITPTGVIEEIQEKEEEKGKVEREGITKEESDGEWFWIKNSIIAKENALTTAGNIVAQMIASKSKVIEGLGKEEIVDMVLEVADKLYRFALKKSVPITKETIEKIKKVMQEKEYTEEIFKSFTEEVFGIKLLPEELTEEEGKEMLRKLGVEEV